MQNETQFTVTEKNITAEQKTMLLFHEWQKIMNNEKLPAVPVVALGLAPNPEIKEQQIVAICTNDGFTLEQIEKTLQFALKAVQERIKTTPAGIIKSINQMP